jgi:glycosyltransferase involved in cell wall biosynthesis
MLETKTKPLLTFALCSFNQERFIKEAVEAALAQTYSPLQIILSDDCSTDRTFELMQDLAASYRGPHQLVLNRNPVNFGLGKHLNRVVEMVRGEFMVVAAGDDISSPNRVEVVWDVWEKSGRKARAIQCGTIDIDDQGGILPGQPMLAENGKLTVSELRPPLADYVHTLKPGILGCALGYDPKLFSTFGPVPDALIHEDNVVALRAFLLGPMLFIDLPLLKRRIHGNNIFSRMHERAATEDAVARQEARFVRDAKNRMVLYESLLADLRTALSLGLITNAEHAKLERECLRWRRLFEAQSEYPRAGLPRKIGMLIGAWRCRADGKLIKWMLLRLPPSRMFQWVKARLNSVRASLSGRFTSGQQKRWT